MKRLGPILATLAVLAALLHVDSHRFADPDLFVTLYAGAQIAALGGPPGVDTASFTVPGHVWHDYEWLARWLFFAVHRQAGAGGLIALRFLVLALILLALADVARRHGAGGLGYAATLVLAFAAAGHYYLFRPTLLSFAFFALTLALIDRLRDGARWPLLVFPVLAPLWANLHAGFPLGVVVLGFALLERALETRAALRALLVPASAMAAAIALSGLHPLGFSVWGAIFETLGSQFSEQISEWQPLWSYGLAVHWRTDLTMLAIALLLVLARRRVRAYDLLLVGSLTVATLLRVRFTPLLALAGAATAARLLPGLRAERPGIAPSWLRPAVAGLAVPLLAVLLVRHGAPDLEIRLKEWLTPVAAVRFLEENDLTGPLRFVNEYDWGGYLHWRAPRTRLFIDGRSDTVYPGSLALEWSGFANGEEGGFGIPDRYGGTIVLLRREHPVVPHLQRDPGWLGLYADEASVVYLRRTPENASWIERAERGEMRAPELRPSDYLLSTPPSRAGIDAVASPSSSSSATSGT